MVKLAYFLSELIISKDIVHFILKTQDKNRIPINKFIADSLLKIGNKNATDQK